ncbi:MAG TPA: lmo0937 family membrane protein [Chthoniobacterales bacterium]
MLWTIVGILVLFWILGLVMHIAGGLVHILLVLALIVAVIRLVQGRGL